MSSEDEVDEEAKVESAMNLTSEEKIKGLQIQLDAAKENFAENTKDLLKKKRAAKRVGLNKTSQINATAEYQKSEVLEESYEKKVEVIQEKIDSLEIVQEEENKASDAMESKITEYEDAAKGKAKKEKLKAMKALKLKELEEKEDQEELERITKETFQKTKDVAMIKAKEQYGTTDKPLKRLRKNAEAAADRVAEEEMSSNSMESSSSEESSSSSTTESTIDEVEAAAPLKKAKKAAPIFVKVAKKDGSSTTSNKTTATPSSEDREVNLMKTKIAIIESDIDAARERVLAKKSKHDGGEKTATNKTETAKLAKFNDEEDTE